MSLTVEGLSKRSLLKRMGLFGLGAVTTAALATPLGRAATSLEVISKP